MTKLMQLILALLAGLIVLAAAGPTLAKLAHALVPLVVVVGLIVAVLRIVWFYTR